MQFTQIASDGGLIPFPFKRDSFELWPAKRREFVVDFTQYQDESPTTKGDVIYLTNVMKMDTGRMWTSSTRSFADPNYKVPVLKIVIGDDAEDNSEVPTQLRELPPLPSNWKSMLDNRLIFEVKRGAVGGETEWLINGQPEEPGRQESPRGPTQEQLQPLGDPERRRGLGAPVPPAHGGTPHGDAQRQGRHQGW
jgi:FtsP/CotA-like multicopper oxidase with cupredoxin domain